MPYNFKYTTTLNIRRLSSSHWFIEGKKHRKFSKCSKNFNKFAYVQI